MKKKGFSLVELLTVLGLLLMLLGTFSTVFLKQVRFCQNIARESAKEQIKNFVIEKIKNDIRAAKKILPASSNKELILVVEDKQVTYTLASAKVRRRQDSYTQYLTDVNEIKNLSFDYPTAKTIKINLENFSCLISLGEK